MMEVTMVSLEEVCSGNNLENFRPFASLTHFCAVLAALVNYSSKDNIQISCRADEAVPLQ